MFIKQMIYSNTKLLNICPKISTDSAFSCGLIDVDKLQISGGREIIKLSALFTIFIIE